MKRVFVYHLCQPDDRKSCAACCGIYNFVHNDRIPTRDRLLRNTRSLAEKEQDFEKTIFRHRDFYRCEDNGKRKLFSTIFNCEFVGFLDNWLKKVGCLLHPQHNQGRDFRHLSFYESEICAEHFCLSYYYLTPSEQRLVIDTIDDWYLYGLTITDIDLIKGVFTVLSNLAGEALDVEIVRSSGELSSIVRSFFEMKLFWPFRSRETKSFGKYLFKGEEYKEIDIPYHRFGRRRSNYHNILLAYGSHFTKAGELDEAEAILRKQSCRFAKIYGGLREGR